jgi:hypothetical protein
MPTGTAVFESAETVMEVICAVQVSLLTKKLVHVRIHPAQPFHTIVANHWFCGVNTVKTAERCIRARAEVGGAEDFPRFHLGVSF